MFVIQTIVSTEVSHQSLLFISHFCLNLCSSSVLVIVLVGAELIFLVSLIKQNLVYLNANFTNVWKLAQLLIDFITVQTTKILTFIINVKIIRQRNHYFVVSFVGMESVSVFTFTASNYNLASKNREYFLPYCHIVNLINVARTIKEKAKYRTGIIYQHTVYNYRRHKG